MGQGFKVRPASGLKRHPAQSLATYRTGTWAWVLHRVSGLLILAYLYFHLIVLSSDVWFKGSADFNRVVGELTAPPFLVADLLLFVVVLYHALNGIRIMLLDLGYGIRHQRQVFWGLMGVGALVMAAASVALLPRAHL